MTDTSGATITRTFAAPADAVFDAWVTPASFAAWFGGSGVDVPVDSVQMDARAGGEGMPDINWFGEFVEVDRPAKLVLTLTDRPGDARELVTVTFTEVDGGTEMLFRQTGGNLSAEDYERTAAGWQTFFDALAALVP
jgi:uncharacterized protein YndB with AHSA1/START domain